MANVGFIGLGIMGAPMAQHLIKGGHKVFLHTHHAIPSALTGAGGVACANSSDVAQKTDTIFLMVPDTPQVQEVLFGDNGVALNIASGPTVADPTTCADALDVIRRYSVEVPASVHSVLESGAGETVKPGDRRLARAETRMVAAPQMALEAAAAVTRDANVMPLILGDAIEGEAREVGRVMAGIAQQVALHSQPLAAPCVLLSGGETTVTVRGSGRGGRNVEFLLALAIALDSRPDVYAIAGDTDGVDGLDEVAGAIVAPDTLARAWAKGIRPRDSLANHDGHGFFEALGDSVITGPTLTNVNDFRAILIQRAAVP
jgi:hydroxypyruvate reductase